LDRIALPLLLAAAPAVAAQVRYEGTAYAASGTKVLYRETHWLYRDGGAGARLVLYRCPDGRAFARKTMRDVPNAVAPDFEFVDARLGYREGVRTRGGLREVFHRESRSAPLVTRPLPPVRGLVIDAGFDRYVVDHWARLETGRVTAPFLVPSRFRALDFRIGDAVDARESGRAVRRFRMTLAGLLGVALPPIELTYDVAGRRLLRFRGPGTVRDARGRLQALRVEFPDAPTATGVTTAEIQSAGRTPLATSCD
jgi:hypothetical protein